MSAPLSKAVLLVGGQGTRLRPLTCREPKALIPLVNEPLLAYEFRLLQRHGVADIVLAVGYKADALRQVLGDGARWGVRLTYVEDPLPLGTAGALKNVQQHVDDTVVVMNGDLVYDVDLAALAKAHALAGAMVTFALRRVPDIRRFGLIQCDDRGFVTAFKEKQEVDETRRNTVNSGLYIMSPEVFDHIPAGREYSNEHDLFPNLLHTGRRLVGHVPEHQGYWADVGTIDAYKQSTQDLLDGAVPWACRLTSGAEHEANGVRIAAPVHIDPSAWVHPGSLVGPHVVVGPRCHIGPGARVSTSILWEAVTVGDKAMVKDSILASGAKVAAGSRLCGEVLA